MKPILISSAIALAIGFAGGWAIKSANQELESFSPDQVIRNTPTEKPINTSPHNTPDRPISDDGTNFNPPHPTPPRGNLDGIPENSDAATNAKWMRLAEVLDLTAEQSKTLEATFAESNPAQSGDTLTSEGIRAAAAQLQTDILAALTPEQQQAFKDLQDRSRNNMIESRAQKHLGLELGNIDLTSQQREQALELIRSRVKFETAAIPDSARLLLKSSFLPVDDKLGIDEEGLLTLDLLAQSPDAGPNSFEIILSQRKQELESRMSQFEDILTPAQMAAYRLGIEESLANIEKIAPQR